MPDALTAINLRRTPQAERADTRQVPNSAGGYTFAVNDLARLRRFLVLGTEGGTYYATERELTKDNAALVLRLAEHRTAELVAVVVEVSTAGRAPKPNPALFALAAASALGDLDGRRAALDALPRVARTGTHLFLFAGYAEQFRGWGRGLRRAVAAWYADQPVEDLAYQAVKYRQREGWSHRDLLRSAHPTSVEHVHPSQLAAGDEVLAKPGPQAKTVKGVVTGAVQTADGSWALHVRAPGADEPVLCQVPAADAVTRYQVDRRALFDWICRGTPLPDPTPPTLARVEGYLRAQEATDPAGWARAVTDYRLPWDCLPDAALGHAAVWEALLDVGIPATALMRQLPRLTNLGLLEPLGPWAGRVAAQLADPERLRRARVHPMNVLVAARTYASGRGVRGMATWTPSRPIIDALDAGFYAAYGAVESTGKRLRLALDVSGSMGMSTVAGLPLTPREASAALALVTANVESSYDIVGFTAAAGRRGLLGYGVPEAAMRSLPISPRQRLDDAVRAVSDLPFGRTDCALPMQDATARRLEVDAFVIYTDNETYAGSEHPHQALRRYRDTTGIDAKLIVCAMTSTGFTIADPADPGMLDVAGLDSTVPNLITDFARGL